MPHLLVAGKRISSSFAADNCLVQEDVDASKSELTSLFSMPRVLLTWVKSHIRKMSDLESRNLFIDIIQELQRGKYLGTQSKMKTFVSEIVDDINKITFT